MNESPPAAGDTTPEGSTGAAGHWPESFDTPLFAKSNLGWRILFWYLAGSVFGAITGTITAVMLGSKNTDSPWIVVASLLGTGVGFAGGPLYLSRRWGTGRAGTDLGLQFQRRDILRGLGGGLSCYVVMAMTLIPLYALRPDLEEVAKRDTKALVPGGGIGLGVLLVGIVVLTPIAEELFFRGLLNRWLASKKGKTFGIIVGGVIFGLAHSFNQPVGVPSLIAVGIVFSWLAAKYGRLGPSIWAHGIFNAINATFLVTTGFVCWPGAN